MPQTKTRMSRGKRRPVAGREEILRAARTIGVADGWKAVTIRAVALKLGYTAPLLYEHFRDKGEILTQLAIEGQVSLDRVLSEELSQDVEEAILTMVKRYWRFVLANTQLYRLMNGMDGVLIDRKAVRRFARNAFRVPGSVIERWVAAANAEAVPVDALIDEIWALLHGMAALYLDRSIRFTLQQAQRSVLSLLKGYTASESEVSTAKSVPKPINRKSRSQ